MNIAMMENNYSHRFPAEWEGVSAVMISWPHKHTDWAHMLDEVCDCTESIIRALQQEGLKILLVGPDLTDAHKRMADIEHSQENPYGVIFIEVPTNDTWIRDYGPLTTIDENGNKILNDFKFNGWGLKFAADKDNLVTRTLFNRNVFSYISEDTLLYNNCLNIVFEGGSIESDGKGTLMTTSRCLLSPNRNGAWTREDTERTLLNIFGARKLLWIEHGELEGDDTDAHVDTLARLAPHNTIIFCGCDNAEDIHFEPLQSMKKEISLFTDADGLAFNLLELPLPDPIFDEEGLRLPATYANYLVTPAKVLVPSYGQPLKDLLARQIIAVAYNDREIVSVDCRALIRQHGSLHCATMQIP